jgi:DUF2934 family protein
MARRRLDVPREDIARRAFDIYQSRGEGNGHDLDDWYEAERQLSEAADGGAGNADELESDEDEPV